MTTSLPSEVDPLGPADEREEHRHRPAVDSATLSPMLKRLDSRGLITRSRSAVDERATEVELTRAGTALRRRARKIPPAVVDRLGVSLDELALLRDVLTRVNTAALAAGTLDN